MYLIKNSTCYLLSFLFETRHVYIISIVCTYMYWFKVLMNAIRFTVKIPWKITLFDLIWFDFLIYLSYLFIIIFIEFVFFFYLFNCLFDYLFLNIHIYLYLFVNSFSFIIIIVCLFCLVLFFVFWRDHG